MEIYRYHEPPSFPDTIRRSMGRWAGILAVAAMFLLAASGAVSQYSQDVHKLRSASEQYDERGYEGGRRFR